MYTFEILMGFPFRFGDNEKNGRGNREKLHKSAKDFYAYILLYHYRLIFSPWALYQIPITIFSSLSNNFNVQFNLIIKKKKKTEP